MTAGAGPGNAGIYTILMTFSTRKRRMLAGQLNRMAARRRLPGGGCMTPIAGAGGVGGGGRVTTGTRPGQAGITIILMAGRTP